MNRMMILLEWIELVPLTGETHQLCGRKKHRTACCSASCAYTPLQQVESGAVRVVELTMFLQKVAVDASQWNKEGGENNKEHKQTIIKPQ